jgi:hypothetical protein
MLKSFNPLDLDSFAGQQRVVKEAARNGQADLTPHVFRIDSRAWLAHGGECLGALMVEVLAREGGVTRPHRKSGECGLKMATANMALPQIAMAD